MFRPGFESMPGGNEGRNTESLAEQPDDKVRYEDLPKEVKQTMTNIEEGKIPEKRVLTPEIEEEAIRQALEADKNQYEGFNPNIPGIREALDKYGLRGRSIREIKEQYAEEDMAERISSGNRKAPDRPPLRSDISKELEQWGIGVQEQEEDL